MEFLNAWEPLMDALIAMDMDESGDTPTVCEHRVRSILRAFCCLTLITGMYLADENKKSVSWDWIDWSISQLHDNVLRLGGYSMIDLLSWPANSGFVGPFDTFKGYTKMLDFQNYLERVDIKAPIPVRAVILESWVKLFEHACHVEQIGVSGWRLNWLEDTKAEILAGKSYSVSMPISQGKDALLTPSEAIDNMVSIIRNTIDSSLWGPAMYGAFQTLHASRCFKKLGADDSVENMLMERLLAPALTYENHFDVLHPDYSPMKFVDKDGNVDAELLHQHCHEFTIPCSWYFNGDAEEKSQSIATWIMTVAQFQLSNGYPSFLEQSIQTHLADSWATSAFNYYLGDEYEEEEEIDFELSLEELVPSEFIKGKIRDFVSFTETVNDSTHLSNHLVFQGNPGTGKTTVAEVMGQILKSKGLLTKGHVVSVSRADLVAGYVGQTAIKTAEAIEKAEGGVLFIDEAYALKPSELGGSSGDFGQEAIDTLLREMENKRDDLIVIVAGYTNLMQRFLTANPGLQSRFPNVWVFPDLTLEELSEAASTRVRQMGFEIDHSFESEIAQQAKTQVGKEGFANARWARNMAELGVRNAASRRDSFSDAQLTVFGIDISPRKDIRQSAVSLEQALEQLNAMHGLADVKKEISDLVAVNQLNKRREKEGMPLVESSRHLVFSGPPGTGKTTVARLLGNIYTALEILPQGQVVETSRNELVAGFVGQTALKTTEQLEKARGGILFIDEAYTLIPGDNSGSDFGKEVIDTLLKYMEDHRDELVVIVSGYSDEMNNFLNANPGLKSRFAKTINFAPYDSDELHKICFGILKQNQFIASSDALSELKEICERLVESPNYSSGRTARNLCDQIATAQARRVMKDTEAKLNELLASDVLAAESEFNAN